MRTALAEGDHVTKYGKVLGIFAAAVATGLGSSYITVLTATPSRAEVRELISDAVVVVKETAKLDRETMITWREANTTQLTGLRSDVQRLGEQQAATNALLEMLVQLQRTPAK